MLQPRRLRMLPKPLRRRPTKPQLAALALITILSFGPVVALLTVIGRDAGPVAMLSEGREPPADGARVDVSFTAVSPGTGTMTALLQVEPFPALLDENGLVQDLVLRVNDARGDTSVVFPAGEPLRAVSVTLPLSGRSIVRYPFDVYRSAVLMGLEQTADEETTPVRFTVDVSSQLSDFDVSLDDFAEGHSTAAPAVGVGFELSRATTTTVYAVGIMVLMWGLALAGVAVLWAVTIRGLDVPPWSVGYLVGVLFALAPLRSSLPGSPPPGTLLDFVAFYWCIGLVGLTLVLVIAVWLQRTRPPKPKVVSAVADPEPATAPVGPPPVQAGDNPASASRSSDS